MATKAEDVLARLQALGYGNDTEASQLLTLNTVHKRVLNTRRWRFLQSTESAGELTVGTGTKSIQTLPTTKRIDGVHLEFGTERFSLESIERDQMRALEHNMRDTGVPQYWCVIGNSLHVWPLPDKKYTVVLDLVANPNEITTKGTEVQIPDSHADILVYGTIMGITFRERDWDGHNFARQLYMELLNEMMAQYGMSDRQTAKHVVASGERDGFDIESEWLI